MARKKKKKKQRKPNIPIQTMARPRLEQILVRYEHDELDQAEYISSIEALMQEIGREAVLNAMVGLLENAGNERKEALMVAIPKLGDEQTIKHLWQLVRRSKISVGGKMTVLVILKQMGEEVNLEEPGEYLSWRDIKKADSDEIADIGRFSIRAIIKELQRAKDIDEVEAMMINFEDLQNKTGGDGAAGMMIDELIEMGDSGAADMLAAIVGTTSRSNIRKMARTGLLKLSGRKVFPQSAAIRALQGEQFYAAYSTDPGNPWQQQVVILFERGQNLVQALVFLLDFGHPWNGAIKDFFPTQSMTPNQFQRDLIDRAMQHDVEQRQVPYARARQFILDALEVNQKKKIKLPPEFEQFRHWVDRRVIDPSSETLAYAEQVDAKTVDEWGELKGTPIRGMEVITPKGSTTPITVLGDLDDEFWDDDDEFTFDDLLTRINDEYELEDEEPVLPQEWATSYLSTRHNEGIDAIELDDYWDNISEFVFYLETELDTSSNLVDVQDFHLSEFITKFWDETIDPDSSIEERQDVIDTVSDLYTYLSKQDHIPAELAKRVNEAAASIFKNNTN